MNRIEELNKLPKIKGALDNLINSIASHSNIIDSEKEEIISNQIKKLNKLTEYVSSLK